MALGDEWDETTAGSASKLNGMTVIYGTGSYLAGLDKTKHRLLVATTTNSGFTKDHLYLCSDDGTEVFDLSDVNEHTHTSSDSGGRFNTILIENTGVMDTGLLGFINPGTGDSYFYRSSVTGTGCYNSHSRRNYRRALH